MNIGLLLEKELNIIQFMYHKLPILASPSRSYRYPEGKGGKSEHRFTA